MSTVECPYCEKESEARQDDGFATDESKTYEYECSYCEKIMALRCSLHWSFYASKADCMNGGKHDFIDEPNPFPNAVGKPLCRNCCSRILVDEEANDKAIKAWLGELRVNAEHEETEKQIQPLDSIFGRPCRS